MILAPIKKEDSLKIFNWRNSESIYKWCRQPDLLTESGHAKWFESHQLDRSIKMYSIVVEEKLVGVCGLTDIDLINQRAEFSIYIGPEYQRNGYAKKALRLLLDRGFSCYPLKTIYGETFKGNHAMLMFCKMGFTHEGTRRNFYFKDGKHLDAHLISITKEEFNALKSNNFNPPVAGCLTAIFDKYKPPTLVAP